MSESSNLIMPTGEQIRERAYELYIARGCEEGQELSDWLTAERELKALNPQAPVTKKARPAAAGR